MCKEYLNEVIVDIFDTAPTDRSTLSLLTLIQFFFRYKFPSFLVDNCCIQYHRNLFLVQFYSSYRIA